MTRTVNYSGWLSLRSWGEADDILYLDDKPLVVVVEDDIAGKMVSVRYWITNGPATKEEAQEAFLRTLVGAVDCELESQYSEVTGYLWTDEELKIGGHDLLRELQSREGSYLNLEVDIHENGKIPVDTDTTRE